MKKWKVEAVHQLANMNKLYLLLAHRLLPYNEMLAAHSGGEQIDNYTDERYEREASVNTTSMNMYPTCTGIWSSELLPVVVHPFTGTVGPTVDIPNSPFDVLQLFFTDDLIEDIVAESNRYALQVMGVEAYMKWTRITADEFKAYLGFSILMGIVHLPEKRDYWRMNPYLRYAPIADRITRDRFVDITRYTHFVDNTNLASQGEAGFDRLGKVRPVMNYVEAKCREVYNPNCELAVDEAMIKFQGRSSLKQYMPLKPIKHGIKVWVLADSRTGYFYAMKVHATLFINSDVIDMHI